MLWLLIKRAMRSTLASTGIWLNDEIRSLSLRIMKDDAERMAAA